MANRRAFNEGFEALERPGASALILVDLDGFKGVNDGFGHAAGDAVLVAVSERLRSVVRRGDLVARIGRDEFAVMCGNVPDRPLTSPAVRRDPTAAYLASFIPLGLASNAIGPSVTALRRQVGVDVGAISQLFIASAIGYFIGSILSGRGYDRRLGHRLYAAGLAGSGLAILASGFVSSFGALLTAFLAVGLAGGAIDVGGNTLMVWQRQGNVGPFMNALHLCFGIGALLAPLLINRSVAWGGDVRIAFGVVAALSVAVGAWIWSCAEPPQLVHRAVPELRPELRPDTAADGSPQAAKTSSRRLLGIVAFFFVLYVGLEIGFAGWIHTYAEEIHLGSANVVSAVTTLFWGMFTLGRISAIVVARRIKVETLLVGVSLSTVAAALVLVVANGGKVGVWIGTAAFGFSVAPQFPTMVAFAEEHLSLTGTATSWFMGAAAIGGLTSPWLIGQLFDHVGPKAMPATVLAAAVATLSWLLYVRRCLHMSAAERSSIGRVPVVG